MFNYLHMLNEGDKAPSFNMPTNKGENVSLSKLKGEKGWRISVAFNFTQANWV